MDEKPFNPLKSNSDVLFVFDYQREQETGNRKQNISIPYFTFPIPLNKYKNITLIAFSYGVFMAAYLKDILPKCDIKIAVNGTLSPVHEEFGIPQKIFTLTLENMTELTALKFREKLFADKNELATFNKNLPNRDMESSKNELAALKKYFEKCVDFEYDKVLIGENDRIIPTKNQKNFWLNHSNCKISDRGHFLFYKFNDFDEIINL